MWKLRWGWKATATCHTHPIPANGLSKDMPPPAVLGFSSVFWSAKWSVLLLIIHRSIRHQVKCIPYSTSIPALMTQTCGARKMPMFRWYDVDGCCSCICVCVCIKHYPWSQFLSLTSISQCVDSAVLKTAQHVHLYPIQQPSLFHLDLPLSGLDTAQHTIVTWDDITAVHFGVASSLSN